MNTDFLVIGGGISGLRAAAECAAGGKVIVSTKGEGSSNYAQGGIAAALGEEDSTDLHLTDTLMAGRGLCRKEAVEVLVKEAPTLINELISWGAAFDQKGGSFLFAREGAHSRDRVLRARGDATGAEIMRVLTTKIATLSNVSVLPSTFVLDLLVDDGICYGARLLDEKSRKCEVILAKATILASGGCGQVYQRTTNPPEATGDGIAMAFHAGAVLEDMEFVQFHPTALHLPRCPSFLLSEAMRGEGGRLLNEKGETFMSRYHPEAELAPRDVVCRAIWEEMKRTKKGVSLDLSHLNSQYVKKRFPTIFTVCLHYGIDITKEKIPVSPAAHFMIGGVKTDLCGRTNIRGLFAAGEVACTGAHGANRLASNSLLEGLVFGARAGRASGEYAARWRERFPFPRSKRTLSSHRSHPLLSGYELKRIRSTVQRSMWDKIGIVRTGESISNALSLLSEWWQFFPYHFSTRAEAEVKNMLQVARLIGEAALIRKGSIGVHYRSDCPDGEGGAYHSALVKGEEKE